MLRAVAKHSPDLAQAVVDSGALDALVPCLEVLHGAVLGVSFVAEGPIETRLVGALRVLDVKSD